MFNLDEKKIDAEIVFAERRKLAVRDPVGVDHPLMFGGTVRAVWIPDLGLLSIRLDRWLLNTKRKADEFGCETPSFLTIDLDWERRFAGRDGARAAAVRLAIKAADDFYRVTTRGVVKEGKARFGETWIEIARSAPRAPGQGSILTISESVDAGDLEGDGDSSIF